MRRPDYMKYDGRTSEPPYDEGGAPSSYTVDSIVLETIDQDRHHATDQEPSYLSCDFCGCAEWESPTWHYDREGGLYVCANCAAKEYENAKVSGGTPSAGPNC